LKYTNSYSSLICLN